MYKNYKILDYKMAKEWGHNEFKSWLTNIQDQKNLPITPAEKFFRYYTQGIHHTFNRALRADCNIEKYCEEGGFLEPDMFYDAILEIQKHAINMDIVTFRYLDRLMLKKMLSWGGSTLCQDYKFDFKDICT